MKKILVIAEKPSLAKTIRDALGKGGEYEVTNAIGHIFELAEPDAYLPASVPLNKNGKKVWRMEDLPILPTKWIKIPVPKTKEIVAAIRAHLKDADEVVNAGDPDREGQYLIDEILEELNYKGPVKRVWLQSLTPEGVRAAFEKLRPNSEYKPLSDAAQVRAEADWEVGMNLSRAWTIANYTLISVGRVQTPTLALVVRRDEEIENFKPKDYFEIFAKVKHANGEFLAKWKPQSTDGPGFDTEGYLIDRRIAEAIAAKASAAGSILEYKAENKERKPPLPYNLSKLTTAVNAKLGLGAKRVLDIAQELYEVDKVTSYPRTASQYLFEDQRNGLFLAAQSLAGNFRVAVENRDHPAFNDKKVGEEGHSAIIPTGKDASHLKGEKAAVFEMIARAAVAMFMPPEKYLSQAVTVSLGDEKWTASGKTVTSPGWTALYGKEAAQDEEDQTPSTKLPAMKTGDPARGLGAQVESLKTSPPPRFTEGSLIDAMANIHKFVTDAQAKATLRDIAGGLGTDATRASIIQTLFDRKWIETNKKKQIISTPDARKIIHALPNELTDPVTTAKWESHLANIAGGKLPADAFRKAISQFVRNQLTLVKKADIAGGEPPQTEPCPVPGCGKTCRRMESRKKKGSFYWMCENRNHGLISDENGQPGEEFKAKA